MSSVSSSSSPSDEIAPDFNCSRLMRCSSHPSYVMSFIIKSSSSSIRLASAMLRSCDLKLELSRSFVSSAFELLKLGVEKYEV